MTDTLSPDALLINEVEDDDTWERAEERIPDLQSLSLKEGNIQGPPGHDQQEDVGPNL